MLSRRQLLKSASRIGSLAALGAFPPAVKSQERRVEVNDVQSQLNPTFVDRIITPGTVEEVQQALQQARRGRRSLCVAGGRHAMGGQQFATDGVLVDLRRLKRVLRLNVDEGWVEVEAGIQWPELIQRLLEAQKDSPHPWSIRQKQTGVDNVTLGGSLAANIHGRGLRFPPFVADIESFELLDADGKIRHCSRSENRELFSLATGGYGLFGIVHSLRLRLMRRTKLRRVVELIAVKNLPEALDKRLKEGFLYGDCQYAIHLDDDPRSHPGVFSCYEPVSVDTPIPAGQKQLAPDDWAALYRLTRTDKRQAFEKYSKYYQSTSDQIYWSDTQQLAGDFERYRQAVDVRRGTEMITEVYVTKDRFLDFMSDAHADFVKHQVDMTYGTIRLIEKDEETFLAWADRPYLCIVCNLHIQHTDEGKRQAAEHFRRILDLAIRHRGKYYLTYHRFATRKQLLACYPQFVEFLRLKRKYDDADEQFQSDWYRHHRAMLRKQLTK